MTTRPSAAMRREVIERAGNCCDLVGPRIVGKSPAGRTTEQFLQLNRFERVIERAEFIRAGVYP
jgi:hypothetical protein